MEDKNILPIRSYDRLDTDQFCSEFCLRIPVQCGHLKPGIVWAVVFQGGDADCTRQEDAEQGDEGHKLRGNRLVLEARPVNRMHKRKYLHEQQVAAHRATRDGGHERKTDRVYFTVWLMLRRS